MHHTESLKRGSTEEHPSSEPDKVFSDSVWGVVIPAKLAVKRHRRRAWFLLGGSIVAGLFLFGFGLLVITDAGSKPAASVQGGHVVWFFVSVVASGGTSLQQVWFDILLMLVGLAWLLIRPGLAPILLLGAWQLFAVASNLQAFVEAAVGTDAHRALLVHVGLRLSSIVLMATGLVALRREAQADVAAA